MTTNREAANLATPAFTQVIGRPPTVPELRLLLSKGLKESGYGTGWKRPAEDSGQWPPNNIGAVQVGASGWSGGSFVYTDTHADGTKYQWHYKKYPTAAAGWEDFVRELFVNPSRGRSAVLAAASADDPWAFSYQVVATKYSESSGPDLKSRVTFHYKWLAPAVTEITRALGWPPPANDSGGGPIPVPFPPPAYPPADPPTLAPPPDPPVADPNAALLKALGDNTLALGTVHQDIAQLRRDLADLHATVARVLAAMVPAAQ